MKPWRVLLLLLVPAALLAVTRIFDFSGWHRRGTGLRENVETAIRRQRARRNMEEAFQRAVSQGVPRRVGPVTLILPRERPRFDTTVVRLSIERDLAALPPRPGTWVTVVIPGLRGQGLRSSWWGDAVVAGNWSPCMVAPAEPDTARPWTTFPRALGQCGFAAYGPPGSAVADWMRGIRTGFGTGVLQAPLNLSEAGYLLDLNEMRNYLSYNDADEVVGLLACRDRGGPSCYRILNGPWQSRLRGDLFWWLKQRYGHEKFGRFWRGGGTLDDAAMSAFGRSFTAEASEFFQARFRIEARGPTAPSGSAGTMLALMSIGLLVSVLLARRRVVA